MLSIYLESSALVAGLLAERGSEDVLAKIRNATNVVASVLTCVEVERILIRAEIQNKITAADRSRLIGWLNENRKAWTLMEINEDIRRRAAQTFPKEPLRTLDAIHLASILEFLKIYPDLKVLSNDDRIILNLGALGISRLEV